MISGRISRISLLDHLHQRLGAGEDALKYGHHHDRENNGSPQRMQEDRIETARPPRWERAPDKRPSIRCAPPTACISAHPGAPAVAPKVWRMRGNGAAFKKLEDLVDALSFCRADHGNRRAQIAGQRGRIHLAAAAAKIVRHVEDDQSRQVQLQDRSREHQMPLQIACSRESTTTHRVA